jgi:putative membrane protein
MSRIFAFSDHVQQLGASLYAQCPEPFGYGHMGYGYGGHFMGFILLILFVVVIYLLLRNHRGRTVPGGPSETPLDILKARYAKGEITREQFETMKQDLKT